jgi:hypothetical protein
VTGGEAGPAVLGIGDSGWDRRARPSPAMPRQAGPKTRSSLRTTLPHRKHKEVPNRAIIGSQSDIQGQDCRANFGV